MAKTKKPTNTNNAKSVAPGKQKKAAAASSNKKGKVKNKNTIALPNGKVAKIKKRADGTFKITGKDAGAFNGAVLIKKEAKYKFEERLVPYFLGAESKESNLNLREALISLAKTNEMAALFTAMKDAGFGAHTDSKSAFMRALYEAVRGHDDSARNGLSDRDLDDIAETQKQRLEEFFMGVEDDPDFRGFE